MQASTWVLCYLATLDHAGVPAGVGVTRCCNVSSRWAGGRRAAARAPAVRKGALLQPAAALRSAPVPAATACCCWAAACCLPGSCEAENGLGEMGGQPTRNL